MDVVARFRADITDMSAGLRTLESDLKAMGTQVQSTEQKVKAMGQSLTSAGKEWSLKVTAPLLAIGTAATVMAMDFDSSMTKLISLVGLTKEEVDGMREPVKKMAVEYGKSADEAAKALFFITSAGLRGAKAMETLEASLKASAVGLGETKTIADAVTSALNAYGHESMTAGKATAIMVAAVREGKMEASSLSAVMGRLLPVSSAMGVGFDQVAAALASMSAKGSDAAQGATALRAIMTSLLKPTTEAEEVLASYGTSAEQLRAEIREKGLLETLTGLQAKFGDNATAMTTVFGNVRALTGVLSMMGGESNRTRQIFDALAKTTEGDLNTAFDVTSQTASFKMTQALEAVKDALMDVGEIIMPFVVKFATGMKSIAEWVKELPAPVKAFATGLGAIAAAVGPVLIALGSLIKVFGLVKTAVIAMQGQVMALPGKLAAAARFLMGPWGLALAVATAAIMDYGRQQQDAAAKVDTLTEAIKRQAAEGMRPTAEAIATMFAEWSSGQGTFTQQIDLLGLNMEEFVTAIMSGGPAVDALRGKLGTLEQASTSTDKMIGSARGLEIILQEVDTAFGDATLKAQEMAAAEAAVTNITGEAEGSAAALAGTLPGVASGMDDTSQAADEAAASVQKLDAMFALFDANIAGIRAKDQMRKMLADIGDELAKNSRALLTNEAAARTNRDAVMGLFEQAKSEAIAWGKAHNKTADEIETRFDSNVKAIRKTLIANGFSKADVDTFLGKKWMNTQSVSAGEAISTGLASGIAAAADKATAQARALAKAAIMEAQDVLRTGSPSKVFEQIGRWVSEGFAIGVSMSASGAVQATFRLSQDAIDEFVKGMKSKDKDVQEETRKTFGENLQAAYKDVLSGLRDRVREAKQVRDDFGAAIADAGSGNMSLSGAYTGLQQMQEEQNSALKALMDARSKVVGEATAEQTAEITRLQEAYQTASAATAAYGATTLAAFENQQTRTIAFLSSMRTLMEMGLAENLWQQVYALGAEKGQGLATELINGGATAIAQANGIQAAVDAQATALGVDAAELWKGSAVTLAQKAVDGFEAEWGPEGKGRKRLNALMTALAKSMDREATITVTTVYKSVYESAGKPPGKALGGPVAAGQAYWVGERGPEVFVPDGSGNIIPNGGAPAGTGFGATGGGGNNYSIVVQAGVGDPREIGRVVVETISRFERANGPVFARVGD
jgi:TP901 family phage tail tape measure protein